MPSPFPGMDPYVEGVYRMNFHSSFSNEIWRQLVPKLRPKYIALLAEWTVRGEPDEVLISPEPRYPDVGVFQKTAVGTIATQERIAAASGTMRSILSEDVPHVSVEIRDAQKRRLVTAIEVLSPVNKRGRGRREYHRRRERLLRGGANLVEIDLLSQGARIRLEGKPSGGRYFCYMTRADRLPLTDFWAISLEDSLPPLPIPLLPGDSDVALDLQAAFDGMYDAGGYDLIVDYSQEPRVPLSEAEKAFVAQRLKSAGHRN